MADILDTIGARRSVRIFRPYRDVEPHKMALVMEAARRASHWGNLGAVGAVVLHRATAPKEVLEAVRSPTGAVALETAPVVLVWYCDPRRMEDLAEKQYELVEHGAFGLNAHDARRRIERLLVPMLNRRREEVLASGVFEVDAGQAIAQATLAAWSLGLGSCLCALRDTPKLRSTLRFPEAVSILPAQALGYPMESVNVPPRPRRAVSDLFRCNTFETPYALDAEATSYAETRLGPYGDPPPWRGDELELLASLFGRLGKAI